MDRDKHEHKERARLGKQDETVSRRRIDDVDDDTEFAQEVAATPNGLIPNRTRDREEAREDTNDGTGLGIAAIILTILAFFFWPFVLSVAGIIVGAISVRRGSALGWWAIAIGVVALILSLFTLPFRLLF